MAEHFSPSMLGIALTQTRTTVTWRHQLVQRFGPRSPDWQTLLSLELPQNLPPTNDLLLRTLRRLVHQDFAELSASRRQALIHAPHRVFGIHEATLAEASKSDALDVSPRLELDLDFAQHIELLPQEVPPQDQAALADVRARGLLEGARRLIAAKDPRLSVVLPLAATLQASGTGDLELQATLHETLALSLEAEAQPADAIMERSIAVEKLLGYPVMDRTAEAMVGLAEAYQRFEPANTLSAQLYEDAAAMLEGLPPDWNLPLRRRLAVALRIC